jgi:hypothetical protein
MGMFSITNNKFNGGNERLNNQPLTAYSIEFFRIQAPSAIYYHEFNSEILKMKKYWLDNLTAFQMSELKSSGVMEGSITGKFNDGTTGTVSFIVRIKR